MGGAAGWLVGGGAMAKVIKSMDWSRTPLGPMESWPQSLRTTVSLVQASDWPISLAWGSGHVQIYNDGYWPACGAKHPTSMGQDFRECWASAFPVIGEAYETAWSGRSAFLEGMRMFLDRYGFLEETWFSFSFSPITDESGGVGGLFHPVNELTSGMLSIRRSRTLRDLASRTSKATTSEDAFALSAQVLAESGLDLPFALFYLLDGLKGEARLVAHAGLRPGTAASPERVDLRSEDRPWPIAAVMREEKAQQIDDVAGLLAGLEIGPYPEPPRTVVALPITQPGSDQPVAVMVAGLSARLHVTEPYRVYCDLVAAAVSTSLANAFAHEAERRRTEALAEVDRLKTAFFSNVSHELRTPLTLILGPLEDELAEQDGGQPARRRQRLEIAHRSSLRLLKLVNALLDFARIESGRMRASYESTDLAAQTAELASMFRSATEKAGLSLVIDCQPLPAPVWVDRDMWEKIVMNLLSNAYKHTFEGSIEVHLAWRGDHAELTVADTGVGIPADQLPRLFERFHRVRDARARSHEGTGIGLALVQELIRLHGGTVRVESQEGVGSRFVATIMAGQEHLPAGSKATRERPPAGWTGASSHVTEALHWLPEQQRTAQAAIAPQATDPPAVPRDAAAMEGARRPRILWADDNHDMREYVARLLREHYDVTAVADGATALAAAQEHPPDLVLTDVMMPGLDGFALLRELRAGPRTRMIPVILLSARAGEESAIEGLDAGADDYLVKPFSARELLARVRTHIDLSRSRFEWERKLQRMNEDLEAFGYSVSHDLRAPLRAVSGFSRLLVEDLGAELSGRARHHLDRIAAGTLRMESIIEGLLDLSHLGRGELIRSKVDLSDLARRILADRHAEEPSRAVVADVAADLWARADARLVLSLLENLLGNAWKYTSTRRDAHIELGSEDRDGVAVYFVRDNGIGFDMAHAARLFAPFQRLHRHSEFDGKGIGLATVQRIVARHGGEVWAEAAPDEGATFFFTLESGH